jgi:hypothetical protein
MFSKKDKQENYVIKRPQIINELTRMFKKSFLPGENIALDETMMGFKVWF